MDDYEIKPADEGWFSHEDGQWIPRTTASGQDTLQTPHGTGDGRVAYYNGSPVASVTWQETPTHMMLGSAYTHPDHRGQGLFNALTEDMRNTGKPIDAYRWDNPWLKNKVRDWQRQSSVRPEDLWSVWPKTAASSSWYHLTDNPNFAFDPEHRPENNALTVSPGEYPPGMFVTRDPEHWYNGKDYVRPFVAEIHGPDDLDEGRWGHESFLPAERFAEAQVKRVMPYDAWANEHFYSEPYTGADVREMSPEQHAQHFDATNQYIRDNHPHMLSYPCSSCGSNETWNECQSCGQREDPSLDAYQQRGYMPQFKGTGDFYTQHKQSAVLPQGLAKTAAETRTQLLQRAQQWPDYSEAVHEFPGGHTVRRPTNYQDIHRTGELMGNCWSANDPACTAFDRHPHWPTYESNGTTYPVDSVEYLEDQQHANLLTNLDHPLDRDSQRRWIADPDGIPRTVWWEDNSGNINEALGRHNSLPKPEYQDLVRQYAQANGRALDESDWQALQAWEDSQTLGQSTAHIYTRPSNPYQTLVLNSRTRVSAVGPTMYHVAPSHLRASIHDQGLKLGQESPYKHDLGSQGIYLWDNPESAHAYARTLCLAPEQPLALPRAAQRFDIWQVNADGLPLERDPGFGPTVDTAHYTPEPIGPERLAFHHGPITPEERAPDWMRESAASTYYHHCTPEEAELIAKHGLDPAYDQTGERGVYLTTSPTIKHGQGPYATFAVDTNGLNLEPDPAYAEAQAAGLWPNDEQWFIHRAQIAPERLTRISAAQGPTYYHVAPQSARDSILANGLDHTLGQRGTDYGGYIANEPGNYLWADEQHARNNLASKHDFDGTRPWDLYQVDANGLNLRPDQEWGGCHYSPEPIGPERLRLLTDQHTSTAQPRYIHYAPKSAREEIVQQGLRPARELYPEDYELQGDWDSAGDADHTWWHQNPGGPTPEGSDAWELTHPELYEMAEDTAETARNPYYRTGPVDPQHMRLLTDQHTANGPQTIYHTAPRSARASILSNGINPALSEHGRWDDRDKGFYGFTDPEEARWYADYMGNLPPAESFDVYQVQATHPLGPGTDPYLVSEVYHPEPVGPEHVSLYRDQHTAAQQHRLWHTPGEWARGLVTPQGEVYTWPEEEMDHSQRWRSLGLEEDNTRNFLVTPKGYASPNDDEHGELAQYIQDQTGLKPATDLEHYGSSALGNSATSLGNTVVPPPQSHPNPRSRIGKSPYNVVKYTAYPPSPHLLNHTPQDENVRGLVTENGQVHTWPEDWATHGEYAAANDLSRQRYWSFYMNQDRATGQNRLYAPAPQQTMFNHVETTLGLPSQQTDWPGKPRFSRHITTQLATPDLDQQWLTYHNQVSEIPRAEIPNAPVSQPTQLAHVNALDISVNAHDIGSKVVANGCQCTCHKGRAFRSPCCRFCDRGGQLGTQDANRHLAENLRYSAGPMPDGTDQRVLYHHTYPEAADSIERTGLDPAYDEATGGQSVYLTDQPTSGFGSTFEVNRGHLDPERLEEDPTSDPPSDGAKWYVYHGKVPPERLRRIAGSLSEDSPLTYLHASDQEFEPGDEILPAAQTGHQSEWEGTNWYDPNYVYLRDHRGDPVAFENYGANVYEVEPLGEVRQDPEHDPARYDHPEDDPAYYSWITPKARVVRKVTPEDEKRLWYSHRQKVSFFLRDIRELEPESQYVLTHPQVNRAMQGPNARNWWKDVSVPSSEHFKNFTYSGQDDQGMHVLDFGAGGGIGRAVRYSPEQVQGWVDQGLVSHSVDPGPGVIDDLAQDARMSAYDPDLSSDALGCPKCGQPIQPTYKPDSTWVPHFRCEHCGFDAPVPGESGAIGTPYTPEEKLEAWEHVMTSPAFDADPLLVKPQNWNFGPVRQGRLAALEWHPGSWGKGFIRPEDGSLHTWPTSGIDGLPLHSEMASNWMNDDQVEEVAENPDYALDFYHTPITIAPSGHYIDSSAYHTGFDAEENPEITRFAVADPRLKYVQDVDKWYHRHVSAVDRTLTCPNCHNNFQYDRTQHESQVDCPFCQHRVLDSWICPKPGCHMDNFSDALSCGNCLTPNPSLNQDTVPTSIQDPLEEQWRMPSGLRWEDQRNSAHDSENDPGLHTL